MKRCLILSGILILAFLVCSVATSSFAQDEENFDYSFGTVTNVTSNQIIVREYRYENDEELDVTYNIDPETKLENAASIKDIPIGDIIEIESVERDGTRIAKIVIAAKVTSQESSIADAGEGEPEYSPDEYSL